MAFAVSRGRILTWALEAHVTDHCNLRCAHCCTLSPHLGPRVLDPAELERDLCGAARALHPAVFKLTGGEPLLHPDIVTCVRVARVSGISDQISLTTNGRLLGGAPESLFEAVDRITVSDYSSAPLPERLLLAIRKRCAHHGVLLTVKRIDRFQRMDAETVLSEADAHDVHSSCWLKIRCHMIREGRFYACTRPPHIEARLRSLGRHTALTESDGVELGGPFLLRRLLGYLESDEPLASCHHCLGTSGAWDEHRQLPRAAAHPAG